jgi:mannose/fructose-specific phosphotransferase system component IIA
VSPLRGVVVGHGELAAAMVHAAEEITGVRGLLVPVSNVDCSRNDLETRVRAAVGAEPTLVFVDLPGGSCFFAAMRSIGKIENARVVAGVNLTMLVDFVFHRDTGLDEAAARAREVGGRAIAGA